MDLRAGDALTTIWPERGAGFARLACGGRELMVPVPDGADPNTGFRGSFLMAPWTNRLDAGRIVVDGTEHRMPINRPEEDTALHGFLRDMAWDVVQAEEARCELACRFDRLPFTGRARMVAALAPDHLALQVELANEGAVATPMGFGWHPYFVRPSGTRISFRAATAFGRDARNLPVDPRPTAGVDAADEDIIGYDGHYAGWDGVATIAWPDGATLRLTADGAWARNLHLFAPRGAASLAVEPVTHAPDAANRAAAAAHGAMHVLAPGESLHASLMIHWC
jgi:aldose 1-epimerase